MSHLIFFNYGVFHHLSTRQRTAIAQCLKMSHLIFLIMAFSTNFCPFKIDLSGTLFDRKFKFSKICQIDHF